MNIRKIISTTTILLLAIFSALIAATPSSADNPTIPLTDEYGNITNLPPLTPPTTTEPAAPPPPPAAPVTTPTTPPSASAGAPPPMPPPPSDNTTPPPPRPPRPTPPYTSYDWYNRWAYSYPYFYQYYSGYYYPNYSYPYYYSSATVRQAQTIEYTPVINSFTADPSYLQPGQPATLSWNVSYADLISISPSVGSVAASGSFAVVPEYTTTYTLTATNNTATVSASTTVTVAPYVASTYYSTYGTGSTTIPETIGSTDTYTGTLTTGTESTYTTGATGISSNVPVINQWLLYAILIGLLAIAAAVIIALLVRKPATAHAGSHTAAAAGYTSSGTAATSTQPTTSTPVTTPGEATLPAKFESPGGTTMPVTGKPLGRRDLQALVSPDKADLISRKHIEVTYENSQYFIEDINSTNGTKLNGSDIRGTGKHSIANGDKVELAGVLTLTFKV